MPRLLLPAALVGVIMVPVVAVGGGVGAGATASATPSNSTTLSFTVVGTPGGGLHLTVAPDGGLVLPEGGRTAETVLPRAAVRDDRGGGSREWSATVSATGMSGASVVSYRVVTLRVPDSGTVLNRMPGWTTVRTAREAVAATGIAGPSMTSEWDPRLSVTSSSGSTGSVGAGSVGSGSVGSGSVDAGSLPTGSGSTGSSGSSGSTGDSASPARAALVTSVM
ncbi:hypothetical protein NGF75_08435 [Dietzia kunjamensis]|uniref:hypothetical protein n=1 Tax=Dietzia kunjamensis TaxID=322509 RepID=UPI002DBB446B|nr:hypothetical protein [Dietzia kunjamensis]MEB8326013.1 hypothetical protein [Dietzia kunjamensis]